MEKSSHNSTEKVGQYYAEWTDRYLESFGTYFQALQTTEQEDLMWYIADLMHLGNGMKVLDAGCGVGGPALSLAKRFEVQIEGITISDNQVAYAEENKARAELRGSVNFSQKDFHLLDEYYPENHFDIIYFLESLVHSNDPERVIRAVRKVLKPQGVLYIKDLFKGPRNPVDPQYVEYAIQATNEQFCLHVREMGDILNLLTQYGFRLSFCRTPEVDQNFDLGNAFTAKYLFQLKMDQEGPWTDEGFIFLHWMEVLAHKHY